MPDGSRSRTRPLRAAGREPAPDSESIEAATPVAVADPTLPTQPRSAVRSVLSPELTPRPAFHVTRRLVGVSKYPLALLTAIYAINLSHQYLLPAVFPLIKEEFHLSDSALGLLAGSYVIVVTLGTVPFGVLADRVRRTRIIGWGTAAWGYAMILTGLAGSFAHLFAARTLLGIADPADNPTSQSLLADYYPVNQRGKVMGVYQMGQLMGIFAIPVGAAMATAWGWRSAFYFLGIPGFVVAFLAFRLPDPERGIQDRRYQNLEAQPTRPSVYDRMSSLQGYLSAVRVPTVLVALASSAIASFFFGGIGIWVPTFLTRYHDLSVAEASTAVGLFALGGLAGTVTAGYLADYLTYAGLASGRIVVAGVARILAFVLLFAAFTAGNLPLLLTLFTLGAAAIVAPQAALNAARADVLHPSLRGRGTAIDSVAQAIGAAVSPILFGIIADAASLKAAFLVLSPLSAIGGLLLLVLGPRFYRRDEQRVLDLVAEESRPDAATARRQARRAARAKREGRGGGQAGRSAPSEALLAVEDADFSYGPIQALFGASLEVPHGSSVALVGPNGAGKTTLLQVASGILEPQRGRVWFDGQEITGVPPDQRARLGITQVGGGRSTFPSLSVADNLWMGAYPFCDSRKLVQERTEEVLAVFPALAERLSQPAGTLSGGEQQMMMLGRALMAGPRLLLVDELSMGLAPVITQDLLRVVREILGLGTTLLVVEQSANVVLEVAERVYLMEKGEIRFLGDKAKLLKADDLARLMGMGTVPSP